MGALLRYDDFILLLTEISLPLSGNFLTLLKIMQKLRRKSWNDRIMEERNVGQEFYFHYFKIPAFLVLSKTTTCKKISGLPCLLITPKR
jgi:hypothetical protein